MVSTGRLHGFESLEGRSLLLALDFTGAKEALPQPFTLRFGIPGAFRDHVPNDREAAAALAAIDWQPRDRVARRDTVTYLPWEYKPGPDRARWPHLAWVYQGGTLPRPPSY
jgi:hypothetical protein